MSRELPAFRSPSRGRWGRIAGVLLVTLAAGGCDQFTEEARVDPSRVEYDVRSPALPAGTAGLPFDPRVARLLPEEFEGTEQICDLTYVGAERPVSPERAFRLRFPTVLARHARCVGTTGQGWADLYFRKDRTELSESLARGRRIRAQIHAARGGFRDYPILEVLESIGESPDDAPTAPLEREPSVADSFVRPEPEHTHRTCAVAYAGPIERVRNGAAEILEEDEREPTAVRYRGPRSLAPYPSSASHRMSVVCRHARGEAWVDLVFTRETFPAALDVHRGRTMAIRVVRSDGGVADYPIGVFVPLGAAAPVADDPAEPGVDGGVEAPGDERVTDDITTAPPAPA